MFHPQYWTNSPPTTLFERTQFEADQLFYATFPAARDAACRAALEQNLYDPTSPTDGSTPYDSVQSPDYEQVPDIGRTSLTFSGTTQQLSPALHFDYSRTLHSQHPSSSHHQDHHYPPPVENGNAVYLPYNQPHRRHRYPTESKTSLIPPSSSSSVSAQEPPPSLARPLSKTTRKSPNANAEPQGTTSESYTPPESYKRDFCQLNRHMKPPTLKFTNNCQLAVMRLDRLSSEQSRLNASKRDNGPSHASSSNPSHDPPCQITSTPTEFLLSTPKSPSIGLSSVPSKNLPERKPPLACLFCRGRKIACGPPLPGSSKKTCNQCRKRSLPCHYPSESRRGMRKNKNPSGNTDVSANTKHVKK